MTKEQFEQFSEDYLNWVARERVNYYLRTQEKLQQRFQEEQRKKEIEYRQKLESYKQLIIDF